MSRSPMPESQANRFQCDASLPLPTQAVQWMVEARRLDAEGRSEEAIDAFRQAVVRYGAAVEALTLPQKVEGTAVMSLVPEALWRERAVSCRELGDRLMAAGQFAEAAGILQESVDSDAALPDGTADSQACARCVLECLARLRETPEERLYLLISRHERRQQQIVLMPDSEAEQGALSFQMAQIFARRERPQEASARYCDALELYSRAPATPENLLAQAECHHRLGGLFARSLHDPSAAARHYQEAIALYAAHEPVVYGAQPSLALCRLALAELGPT